MNSELGDYRIRQTPGLCSQCVHLPRCKWLVGAKPWWAECDWWPRRFVRALKVRELEAALK